VIKVAGRQTTSVALTSSRRSNDGFARLGGSRPLRDPKDVEMGVTAELGRAA
jgi:hypothetical protein